MYFLFRLIRNNLFGLSTLVLFGLSLWQVFQYNSFQASHYFNTSNSTLNSMLRWQNNVTQYFYLTDKNAKLAEENAQLRELIGNNFIYSQKEKQASIDSQGRKRYEYITANVISATLIHQNNFITIDKGSLSGVKKGQALISPAGIAGIVMDVSENFSLVMPVINSKFRTTPMIPAIGFKEGSITWDGKDPTLVQLDGVNKFENLKKGMLVVSSSFSNKFPENISIGHIERFSKNNVNPFFKVDVKLSTDFRRLGKVYVVTDLMRNEIDTLQNQEVIP